MGKAAPVPQPFMPPDLIPFTWGVLAMWQCHLAPNAWFTVITWHSASMFVPGVQDVPKNIFMQHHFLPFYPQSITTIYSANVLYRAGLFL